MTTNRLETLLSMYDDKNHDSFILFAIAKEYEYLEELEKAKESYLSLKERDPNYVGLYYHLAKVYEILENNEEALMIYEQGISIAKRIADFHALSELNNAKQNLEMGLI
jgi:tetratricopeptide (TPR) repeat protein